MNNDPMITDWLQAIGALGALAFAALAGVFAALAWRESKKANSFPVLIDLVREYRQPRLSEARKFVFDTVKDNRGYYDHTTGFLAFDATAEKHVRALSNYYDNVGALVASGAVDAEIIAGFMGDALKRSWEVLGPYIYGERERRRAMNEPPIYQHYFEDLAVRIKRIDPREARLHLKRWPPEGYDEPAIYRVRGSGWLPWN
jgi:hypothetical protein